jgi:3-hydroxybutyryl-CoA dehydratase
MRLDRHNASKTRGQSMKTIENVPFDDIFVGQTCEHQTTVSEQDILLFAKVSGDNNPIHGMYTAALVSAAMALELPGPGSIYLTQTMKFRQPVKIGDTLTVHIEVTRKRAGKNFVTFTTLVTNQHGKKVLTGDATAQVPSEKIVLPAPELPPVSIG